MNKFKKYLSEHPDVAARFEKTGSVVDKSVAKVLDADKKIDPKSTDKNPSKLP